MLLPVTPAKLTVYEGIGRNAWTKTYKNWHYDGGSYDRFDLSIYDRMLKLKKINVREE